MAGSISPEEGSGGKSGREPGCEIGGRGALGVSGESLVMGLN